MEKTKKQLLLEANDIIRSFNSVIERKGTQTNWDALNLNVKRILKEQHSYLYPTKKQIRIKKLNKINKINNV